MQPLASAFFDKNHSAAPAPRPAAALFLALLSVAACRHDALWSSRPRPAAEVTVITTGYCRCGTCCNWKRDWLGRPVVAAGPRRGQRKQVGITATGTRARRGTIAADPAVFPPGTRIVVPGYGHGVVEDRGGDIRGYHLDLFFDSHAEARAWGRVRKTVRVQWP